MSSDDCLSIAYRNLKLICSVGIKVTPIDKLYSKRARSLRTLQLENIVEKIVLHDNSMIHSFMIAKENINELDISIIASAARNIMDITNLYFHISERNIGDDEIELRFNTMFLNGMTNLQDIYSKLGFSKTCFHARIESGGILRTKEDIKNSASFMGKIKPVQDQILSGRKVAVQVKSHNILDKNIESGIYNLLSNSVHGLFIGLGSNSVNNNLFYNNFFTAKRLLTISFQISALFTAHVLKDYLDLRKRLYSELSVEEKCTIKDLKSDVFIKTYIGQLRDEFENTFFDCS